MPIALAATNSGQKNDVNATSHPINMPAGIAAGNLLMVLFSVDSTDGTNPSCSAAGWTRSNQNIGTTTAYPTSAIFYKTAAGGDTCTVTTTDAQMSSHISCRFTGWNGVAPTLSPVVSGTGSNANPGNNTNAGDLWVAFGSWDGTVVPSAAPSTPSAWGDFLTVAHTSSTAGASSAMATLLQTAASMDPGAFTSAAKEHKVWTIGLSGIPAGDAGNVNRRKRTPLIVR